MQVCQKPNHDEETLSSICFDEQCKNRAAICFYCDQEGHINHKKKPIKAFLKEYKTQHDQGKNVDIQQLKETISNFSDQVSLSCLSAIKTISKFQESSETDSNIDAILQNLENSNNYQSDIQKLLNSIILVGPNGFAIKNLKQNPIQQINDYKRQNQLLFEQIERNNQQIIKSFQVLEQNNPQSNQADKPKFIIQKDEQKMIPPLPQPQQAIIQQNQIQFLLNQNVTSDQLIIEITSDSEGDDQQLQKKQQQKQNLQIKKSISKAAKQKDQEKQTTRMSVTEKPIKQKVDQMEEEQILQEPDLYDNLLQKQPENTEEGVDYEFYLSKTVHPKIFGTQVKLICYIDSQRVLLASRDGEVAVYNHSSKEKEQNNLNINQSQVIGLGYFQSMQQIVFGVESGVLQFYTKKLNTYEDNKNRQVDQQQLLFMHCDYEQNTIYTYGMEQNLKCINAKTGKEIFRLENFSDIPQAMQVMPELNLFVIGGQKSLRFYYFDNQKERQSFTSKRVIDIFYHKDDKDSQILVIEENTILKFNQDLCNFQRIELTKYNAKCAGYIKEYEILILGGQHKGKKSDYNDIIQILDRQNGLLETIQLQGIASLLAQFVSVQSTLIFIGDKEGSLYAYNLEMSK